MNQNGLFIASILVVPQKETHSTIPLHPNLGNNLRSETPIINRLIDLNKLPINFQLITLNLPSNCIDILPIQWPPLVYDLIKLVKKVNLVLKIAPFDIKKD